ncbi:DUF6774 domain-containing protein [Pseudoflavonifractor sp. HCP28S3_F10]
MAAALTQLADTLATIALTRAAEESACRPGCVSYTRQSQA